MAWGMQTSQPVEVAYREIMTTRIHSISLVAWKQATVTCTHSVSCDLYVRRNPAASVTERLTTGTNGHH